MSFTTPKPLEAVPNDVKGAVVLVVDDEHAWRLILETGLRMLGYRPLLAADKTEALNQCLEHDPDVAIVDLMLPGPDGWRLVSELRSMASRYRASSIQPIQ
jgi:CheY-like chemotaxis protein